MRCRILMAGVAVTALAACGTGTQPSAVGPAPTASPSAEPAMVASPPRAAAGELVDLRFPGENVRGIAFQLRPTDPAAGAGYLLTTGREGSEPGAHAWDSDWAIPDVGVIGPGPDTIRIPVVAPPGDYKLCTANAQQQLCVDIGVLDAP